MWHSSSTSHPGYGSEFGDPYRLHCVAEDCMWSFQAAQLSGSVRV